MHRADHIAGTPNHPHATVKQVIGADEQPVSGAADEVTDALPTENSTGSPAERWVAEHGDMIWRFALSRTRSRSAAEEVFQETIIAAMQGFKLFAGRSSERTWLLGIAAHKATDFFRKQRRNARVATGGDSNGDSPVENRADGVFTKSGKWARLPGQFGGNAGDAAEDAEILAALRKCIEALPPGLAEAIWLRDLLDVPSDEVCKATGLTPTNLWTRTHRARSALRLCVENAMGLSSKERR